MTHLRNGQNHTSRKRVVATALALLLLGSCAQETIDPTQPNERNIRIETITSAGNPARDVQVTLRESQAATAATDFEGNTGDTGAVSFRLPIPTFGHSYELLIDKNNPSGGFLFSKPIYPLNLKCTDTVIRIVVPEADTTTVVDSLCGGSVERTLLFYACADSSALQSYIVRNCGATAYTITPGPLAAPFSISPASAINVPGGGRATFTITYNGLGQTSDASAKETLGAGVSGKITLILLGHVLHDCSQATQLIECGTNKTSDSVRFGTICTNKTSGPSCTSFINASNSAIAVTLPTTAAPISYTVTNSDGTAASVPGSLTLQPNQSMTVCVSILLTNVGPIADTIVFPMQCAGGTPFRYTVPVSAIAKLCDTCDCSPYIHDPVTFSQNIPVGTDTVFWTPIFQNTLDCPVTISNPTSDSGGWSLLGFSLSPPTPTATLPVVVGAGSSLYAQFRFAPKVAGSVTDHLLFQIAPSQGAPCSGEIDLTATGCHDACASVTMPPEWQSRNGKPDTLYFHQGANDQILVSLTPGQSASDQECITLTYPDTGCGSKTISVVPPADQKFIVTPTSLTLSPTHTSDQICVTFTAPVIAQVRKDFTQPNEELKETLIK